MTKKKTLYEILELPQDAPYPDIHAAHERLVRSLEGQQPTLSRDDYQLQLRLLRVAHNTLATPMSRDAYDAHLSLRNEPVKPGSALLVAPADASTSAAALRADAMLVRADAMALRADALGLKADIVSGSPGADFGISGSGVVQRLLSSFKKLLLILGTLAALSMILKVVFLFMASGQPAPSGGDRSQVGDKVFLQEYYQTHGVRAASRAEAELMDAQRRKSEEAERAQRRLSDNQLNAAQTEQRFEEESRRRGEQASIELQYAEQKARLAQQQEERQKEEEQRMKAEAERRRVEAEQAKWRRALETSSNH